MSIITQLLTTIPTQVIQSVPTIAGTAYEGGYYAGRIKIGTSIYALVVAPKASGYTTRQWRTYGGPTTGTLNLNDGWTNSQAMNNSLYPAAEFCRSLNIGGFTDWYLPSRDELEICYRNLKPTTDANTIYSSRIAQFGSGNGVDGQGNGDNDYAVNITSVNSAEVGAAYTIVFPTQTSIALFKTSGSECFESNWVWSSTEDNSSYVWLQSFNTGYQNINTKSFGADVRAVRKVLIS